MIIIRFYFRKSVVTWFINEDFVLYFSFILGLLIGFIYTKYLKKKRSTKRSTKIRVPKGGSLLDPSDCINVDEAYEVKDVVLEILIKKSFDVPIDNGPFIITRATFIALYYVKNNLSLISLNILSPLLAVNTIGFKLKILVLRFLMGLTGGFVVYLVPFVVNGLLPAFLNGLFFPFLIALVVWWKSSVFFDTKCTDLVVQLPVQTHEKNHVVFLPDKHKLESPIYVLGNDKIKPYVFESETYEISKQSNVANAVQKFNSKHGSSQKIKQHCEKNYIPLEQRTKTMHDLFRENPVETRRGKESYIKKYRKRRQRIMEQKEY